MNAPVSSDSPIQAALGSAPTSEEFKAFVERLGSFGLERSRIAWLLDMRPETLSRCLGGRSGRGGQSLPRKRWSRLAYWALQDQAVSPAWDRLAGPDREIAMAAAVAAVHASVMRSSPAP